jgi:exonuclease VII large subunit
VASLLSDNDGGYFRLFNKEGGAIISLFTKETDLHGHIDVRDSNGNMRAAIFSNRDGGNILVYNKDGKLSARLVTTTESSGQFALYNQKGDSKVQIFSTVDGGGNIYLFNDGGQALVEMGYYTTTKKPFIQLNKKELGQ